MKLGEIIDAIKVESGEKLVRFDALNVVPTGFDSYRGYYDQLAIGFDGEYGVTCPVASFLERCKEAVGSTFTGWKGGDYTMSEKTKVWVANPGIASGFTITRISSDDHYVTLHTGHVD